ncbi:hypothetical protein ACFQRD_07480 [Brachybacterium sp. GCM10030268]|uniref:hypothetical protein n=1 Tax=Brachybacterium sp. GCM10030268 TaxID=3273382 RepID=UPI00360D7433
MDHDSVPFSTPGPSSHRSKDIRETYERITREGLEVMGEQINSEPAYTSNVSGHLAWDVSLLVRAACAAWRATADPVHLRQAASWAQHLCERTDVDSGTRNWRGRVGNAWSAGPRYTAATAPLGSIAGVPIQIQAAADAIRIERPTTGTVTVHAMRDGSTIWSSPEASVKPDARSYLPDVLAEKSAVHAVLLRNLPAPIDLSGLEARDVRLVPQFAPHLVHTGMITRSLLSAAQALDAAGPRTPGADVTPDDLFTTAERALAEHDQEIRTLSGQSWYITPEDFPGRRLGLDLPHNHIVDVATSLLVIGDRRDDKSRRTLGASLTRRFTREIDAYEAGVIRHPWFYYPVDSDIFFGVERERPLAERRVRAVRRAEDSSHATMRVRALAEWRRIDSKLVEDATLSSVALSFRRHFIAVTDGISTLRWLPGDANDAPRQGYADTYAGAWGALAPWDRSIKRRINSIAFQHPPSAVFGATVLSAAEILELNS